MIEARLDQNKPFPRSILSVSREEFGRKEDNPRVQHLPLELIVKAGSLPTDITGHVFIVGTVGSYDSTYRPNTKVVYPSSDGFTPMYNGDGMIYRLDFDRVSEARLTTRIAKAPCYYADIATSKVATNCKFDNRGITRLSEKLGVRNQLNTAFLPMTFVQGGDRLLVTWDIGRPYEIDPQTLELATPVGWNDEWRAMNPVLADIPFLPPFPFKLIQSSAHPCFDVHTKEMFTVNSGRSLSTFISQLRPLIYGFLALIEVLREPGKLLQVIITSPPSPTSVWAKLSSTFKRFVQFLHNFLQLFNIFTNFVYVIRWDGKSRLQKWKVVHPSGCAVKISQSMHQIGITEDYIVLMDTAFKFLLEELLPPETSKKAVDVERVLRKLLDTPQLPDNNIYIVRRADLIPENKRVVARKAVIPRETAHFLVDYKNSDRQITIHMPHMCAWDPAEWLRDIDWNDDNDNLQRLYGVIVGAMDISRLGCHVIDAETGKIVRSDMTPVTQGEDGYAPYTWEPELYAYQENPPSGKLENIYWSCLGAWEELLTAHSIAMYGNYKYRVIPVDEIRSLTQKGIKANLLRLHIAPIESVSESENRLQIQDVYEFEAGYFGTSPQFVPIAGKDGSTDGYIVCVVYHDPDNDSETGKEIWIFDAKNLSGGAICKLYHPQMNFGFTVHTTWMPKIARRTASYNVPVREDYQAVVSQQPDYIQEIFNDWVYPQKEP